MKLKYPRLKSRLRQCRLTFVACLLGLWLAQPASAAADFDQTITLQPGWNAIYLQVTPDVADIEAVFAGLPIQSVWRYFPTETGTVEVTDPVDGLMTVTGWFGYFPQPRPEAFLSNLFTVTANQAYLVNLESSSSVTITVSGRPQLRPRRWISNSFNLVGLDVDPANPPTFGEYFADSPAHAGQPVFTLDANGSWQEVTSPSTTLIESGRSYWVFTAGASKFQAPLSTQTDLGDDVDYRTALDEQRLVLENNSPFVRNVTLRRLPGGDNIPLSFELIDEETGENSFPNLPDSLTLSIPPNDEDFLKIQVRRADFTQDRMEDIFVLEDGTGGRQLLFFGGDSLLPVLGPAPKRLEKGGFVKAAALPESYVGLWIGVASVNAVSQSQLAGVTPTPVARDFPLRVLMHVDAVGTARLLKQVTLMWENGTTMPSAENDSLQVVDQPGRYVLVTDQDRLPEFEGLNVRDGQPVGVRYSTIAYDFQAEFLDFNEPFDPLGTLTVEIVTLPEDPTNPFRHKYHPDHDNLDRRFLNPLQEAFEITRVVEFSFSATDPENDQTPPEWGSTVIGGLFREVITGLHKNPIVTSGTFRLRRISRVSTLNG
jgi:hypothetical protein